MAIVLKFKQGDSGTELNLNAGETGFQLSGDGWNPAVATPVYMGDPPPIGESIHLLLSNTSQDNIATNIQSLHQMQAMADTYMRGQVVSTPIWLHAKMDNETGERRSLVHSVTMQYKTSWFGSPATALDIPLVISVVRGPYWESTTKRTFPPLEPSAGASVKYDYTASASADAHDIVGDVGARIEDFHFLAASGDQIGRAWFGIRSANLRTADQLANFDLVWELEDGTLNGNESGIASATADNASGGNVVEVVETDLDWDAGDFLKVESIDVGDVSGADGDDQQGDFLWLLRTRVASGTWEVHLRFGALGMIDADYRKGNIIEVANTGLAMKEMDLWSLPPTNIRLIDFDADMAGGCAIQVWARRTSGSGILYLDCLCPIPIDEGFVKVEGTDTVDIYEIGQDPRLITGGFVASDGPLLSQLGILASWNNFVLPPGDGYIVCAHEYVTQPTIADQISFNFYPNNSSYFERWLSLRGSE